MKTGGRLATNDIARALGEADRELERVGADGDDRLRFRLSAEEILLELRDEVGEAADFTISMRKKGGSELVELAVPACHADPLTGGSSPILEKLLSGWEAAPSWRGKGSGGAVVYLLPLPRSLIGDLSFTWKFTKDNRKILTLAIISQLITVGLKVAAPLISAKVITAYVKGTFEQIIATALALMAIRMLTDILAVACNRMYNVVYNKTLTAIESRLVSAVLRITSRCLDEKGTGLFIQRLTVDTSTLATGFNTTADLISQMVTYIGILAAILIVDPVVFAVVIALLVVQILIERRRTRIMNADDRIYRNASERFSGFVSEMVRGARDVKLMHRESIFEDELEDRINDANNARMLRDNRSWKYKLMRMELGSAGSFGFAALLAFFLLKGKMEPASALVLYNYFSEVDTGAILILGQLMEFIKDFALSNERVRAIVESREFERESFGDLHIDDVKGGIAFDDVSFTYDDISKRDRRYVIRDMSFDIKPGEMAALVGRSGCGKTTAFNLISRLYKTSGGSVRLDGVDINELDADTIRDNIAVVSQNPYLFHMSIRDNLKLAKPDMTEEEMRSACRTACIDDDIEAMPEGYDSMVGEGGVKLSGGQRQRIAIARALLKDFRILLLDEATSALDNTTQSRIQEALENMRGRYTIFIIAHRLTTISGVDRIFYMEDGKILDEGTHGELEKRCPPYRELYHLEKMQDHGAGA